MSSSLPPFWWAVRNLLDNEIGEPEVSLRVANLTRLEAEIHLIDNGTGLAPETFDLMTKWGSRDSSGKNAMGLKLIRRLIENNQGEIRVRPPQSERGTALILILPVSTSPRQDKRSS